MNLTVFKITSLLTQQKVPRQLLEVGNLFCFDSMLIMFENCFKHKRDEFI